MALFRSFNLGFLLIFTNFVVTSLIISLSFACKFLFQEEENRDSDKSFYVS